LEVAIAKLHALLRLLRGASTGADDVPDIKWDAMERAVVLKLANCYMQGTVPDFGSALELLEEAVERAALEQRSDILGFMGRVHLQVGDLVGAKRVFQRAKMCVGHDEAAEEADTIHR
jgi:Tfp pilus assembly protein PilF